MIVMPRHALESASVAAPFRISQTLIVLAVVLCMPAECLPSI
jgi:hypothetical protein